MKTPEEISKLLKERKSSDDKLQAGGAEKKGARLEITEDQFEAAKQEMDKDLQEKEKGESERHKEKKEQIHEQITNLEGVLGQPINEETRRMIHKNEGIPENDSVEEQRSSAEIDGEEIGKRQLGHEAEKLKNEQIDKKIAAAAVAEKIKNSDFSASAKGLAIALRERESLGYNHIAHPEAAKLLFSKANELENLTPESSLEEINDIMKQMIRAVGAIGEVPKDLRIKDNPDSLTNIMSRINQYADSVHKMGFNIAGLENASVKETKKLMGVLYGQLQGKFSYVARKRSALAGYRR